MNPSNGNSENSRWNKIVNWIKGLPSSEHFLFIASMVLAIIIVMLLIQVGRHIFENIDASAVMAGWRNNNSLLQNLPSVMQRPFALLFSGVLLRYIYFPLVGFIGAMLLVAHYVKESYKLPSFWLSLRHVIASLFGITYPLLRIEDGKKKLDPQETNLLDLKGGPGIVKVGTDSVAFFEDYRLPENSELPVETISKGSRFVSQSELVKDVISLEDQHGFIESVPVTTKDGIPILIRDIHFRFRVLSEEDYTTETSESEPEQEVSITSDPYSYSDQAVWDIVYNRIVTLDGLSTWQYSVQLAVQSSITEYVAGSRIDDLTTAPVSAGTNPRSMIRNQLFEDSSTDKFKRLGAKLLWVDIGHFDILMKVERDPRPKNWGEKWNGLSKTKRALGEGERIYYQELGRAEAQAEMLTSILESLQQAFQSQRPRALIEKIILSRTAQVLESMSENEPKPEIPQKAGRVPRRTRRRRRQ